jgi:hypothetical protein
MKMSNLSNQQKNTNSISPVSSVPDPISPIQGSLNGLRDELTNLETRLFSLRDRLAPVINSESTNSATGQPEYYSPCDLTEQINGINERVRCANLLVDDLFGSICI